MYFVCCPQNFQKCNSKFFYVKINSELSIDGLIISVPLLTFGVRKRQKFFCKISQKVYPECPFEFCISILTPKNKKFAQIFKCPILNFKRWNFVGLLPTGVDSKISVSQKILLLSKWKIKVFDIDVSFISRSIRKFFCDMCTKQNFIMSLLSVKSICFSKFSCSECIFVVVVVVVVKHIGLLKMSLMNVLPLVGEVSNRKFIHALMEEKKIVVNLKNLWKRKVVIYKIVVTTFFIIETRNSKKVFSVYAF